MAENGRSNGMPKPEAVWLALGIAVAAMVETFGPKRRARFFAAMRALADEHETQSRVVVFGHTLNGRRDLPHSARVAAAWIRRLIDELEDGAGK